MRDNVSRETILPMTSIEHPPLVLSMGDPAGIGPEICLKAAQVWEKPLLIAGDTAWISAEANRLRLPIPTSVRILEATASSGKNYKPYQHGQIASEHGQAAIAAILTAVSTVRSGKASAMVTAPIHKESLAAAGSPFPGHTEMLAAQFGLNADAVAMMLVNHELRVVLNSIHVSLRDALAAVTHSSVLRTIRHAHQALATSLLQQRGHAPRIAVAGLNPHAGEGGLFGREEIEIIRPAIDEARREGINVSGPYAPDTIFMRARGFKEFDVVICMYHDQGLIPVKYMGLDLGVNLTLGLPIVRTSVDHGTAFDIAGQAGERQGLADPSSLLEAMRVADELSR
jgi:4-hydroxythreonine-4-phosphate dehydrogenase